MGGTSEPEQGNPQLYPEVIGVGPNLAAYKGELRLLVQHHGQYNTGGDTLGSCDRGPGIPAASVPWRASLTLELLGKAHFCMCHEQILSPRPADELSQK